MSQGTVHRSHQLLRVAVLRYTCAYDCQYQALQYFTKKNYGYITILPCILVTKRSHIFYVAQADERALAVAFGNKLCWFESHYRHTWKKKPAPCKNGTVRSPHPSL